MCEESQSHAREGAITVVVIIVLIILCIGTLIIQTIAEPTEILESTSVATFPETSTQTAEITEMPPPTVTPEHGLFERVSKPPSNPYSTPDFRGCVLLQEELYSGSEWISSESWNTVQNIDVAKFGEILLQIKESGTLLYNIETTGLSADGLILRNMRTGASDDCVECPVLCKFGTMFLLKKIDGTWFMKLLY